MASKRFSKDSEEFQFFGEFWKMAQKYYLPEDNDEYWDELINDSNTLGRKYRGIFYRSIIQGFIDYAEKVIKERKQIEQED